MARDIFVRWGDEVPTREDLQACLEDYVAGLAMVEASGDRFLVHFPGAYSFPFARVGPATEGAREHARSLAVESDGSPRSRWFEVCLHDDCIDVVTRTQDEVTNNIAKGFAELCARGWVAKIEE